MIFGLHPLFGFLPLLLYIVLMMMGKDMNVSVLLCVILGAILTGESITGFADTLYASLGSFCALIGFIIVLGSGLAEVLSQTKVAHNLVYMVVNRFKLKSKKMAILISMITSTLLVSLLGTLAGSNAIIAPILIPIVASVGLTPSTLGVILHGAGATGLYVGPFVPPGGHHHRPDWALLRTVPHHRRHPSGRHRLGLHLLHGLPHPAEDRGAGGL